MQPSAGSARNDGLNENGIEFDETVRRPAAVSIRVEGAFIIDEQRLDKQAQDEDGISQDTEDIRLPQHSAIVSHVAVDVGVSLH